MPKFTVTFEQTIGYSVTGIEAANEEEAKNIVRDHIGREDWDISEIYAEDDRNHEAKQEEEDV